MHFLYQTVNDSVLAEKINAAEHSVTLTVPGVNISVAEALVNAVERLDGNVHLLIDASLESFTLGYNEPQAVLLLQDCIRMHGLDTFRCEDGIRIGVLSVDDEEPIFFLPESVMLESLNEDSYNSAFFDENRHGNPIGETNLYAIQVPSVAQIEELRVPKTKEEQLFIENIELKKRTEELEKRVEELKQDEKVPVQRNLQFIEIVISDFQIGRHKFKLPKSFMTSQNEVNERLESKYSIVDPKDMDNLEIKVLGKRTNYMLSDFFREANEIRNTHTFLIGKRNRLIRVSQKKAFELDCKHIKDTADLIRGNLSNLLQERIRERLVDLYCSLENQVQKAFKQAKSHNLVGTEMDFFENEIMKANKSVEEFFAPQIHRFYKDISREDAGNAEFRKEIEEAIGPSETETLFSFQENAENNAFLFPDEILVNMTVNGQSVILLRKRYNEVENALEISRGIQNFWARIIDFLSEEDKDDLENALNQKITECEGKIQVSLRDYSYMDLVVFGKADTGLFGNAPKEYVEDVLLGRPKVVDKLTPDNPLFTYPQKYAANMSSYLLAPLTYVRPDNNQSKNKQKTIGEKSSFSTDLLKDGFTVSGYLLETKGIRSFEDFVCEMTNSFGDKIIPYLRTFYNAIREYPGMEHIAKEMDSREYVDEYCKHLQ